jgi:hypothetical protein
MAFPALPNPFDVLANPFAAAQGFISQLPPLPSGQRVTQIQTSGGTKTVALGDGFLDSQELAQWVNPIQQKLAALEYQQYGQRNTGMSDMMPVFIVLLLGGGLTGSGTGSIDTTTLLILVMLMGQGGGGGFGGGDNSTMMLMMVLLLGGSI